MNSTEIILTFRRSDFEELYFKDDNEKIFFGATNKKKTYSTIAFILLCIASMLYCYFIYEYWQINILILVVLIYKIWEFNDTISERKKWKKSVIEYIDHIAKYKNYKIIITDNSFCLILGENETIERWTEFTKSEINDKFISLKSKSDTYTIPKKSVRLDEYEFLKSIIKEKLAEISEAT